MVREEKEGLIHNHVHNLLSAFLSSFVFCRFVLLLRTGRLGGLTLKHLEARALRKEQGAKSQRRMRAGGGSVQVLPGFLVDWVLPEFGHVLVLGQDEHLRLPVLKVTSHASAQEAMARRSS